VADDFTASRDDIMLDGSRDMDFRSQARRETDCAAVQWRRRLRRHSATAGNKPVNNDRQVHDDDDELLLRDCRQLTSHVGDKYLFPVAAEETASEQRDDVIDDVTDWRLCGDLELHRRLSESSCADSSSSSTSGSIVCGDYSDCSKSLLLHESVIVIVKFSRVLAHSVTNKVKENSKNSLFCCAIVI